MDRRRFLRTLGIGSAGIMLGNSLHANILNSASVNPKIKPITGSWIEFQHHLPHESEYWDKPLAAFTADQWKRKIFEMREIGLEYLVLMSVALFGKSLYPSSLAPQMKLGCDDPLEAVLSAADECGIKFFISNDYWGDLRNAENMMTDGDIRKVREKSMVEIASRYGHHNSFYGWYFPNEAQLQPYFTEHCIKYVNDCARLAKSLTPNCVNLIAPYGVVLAKNDDTFVKQLERLDIEVIAYQDGVGVNHTRLGEAGRHYENLYKAHQKAGRSKIWADMELFYFEQGIKGNLMPADFETRIIKQMEDISPFVERILVYQYTGIMNKPDTDICAGHPESIHLYNQYKKWLDSTK